MLTNFSRRISRKPRPYNTNLKGYEGPRGYVGAMWYEIGELQFKFLVDQGLRPEHTLLDIACGSLRFGTRVIPYLNTGNYLGIDIKPDLIAHGKTSEVGETMCELKKPEFVVSGSFEFEKFSKRPDFAMAQSLFTHLVKDDIELCLRKLSEHCKGSTVLYATIFETQQPIVNPARSHPHTQFDYTKAEMSEMGKRCGWRMDYIGDWKHPRAQKMLRYVPA